MKLREVKLKREEIYKGAKRERKTEEEEEGRRRKKKKTQARKMRKDEEKSIRRGEKCRRNKCITVSWLSCGQRNLHT